MKCPNCKTKMDQEAEKFQCPGCNKRMSQPRKKRRNKKRKQR